MGTLSTLVILVSLGAGGQAAPGETPTDVKPTAGAKPAPDAGKAGTPAKNPPAPPRQYLEAGIRLFNKERYDLAGKYFTAADMFRDRLSANERVVLDVYREQLAEYRREREAAKSAASAPKPAPSVDTGVVAANAVGRSPAAMAADPIKVTITAPADPGTPAPTGTEAPPAGTRPVGAGTDFWRAPADPKAKARWLLQLAREQIFKGRYGDAEKSIAEAEAMDIRWGYFDVTPAKMAEHLAKARAKASKEPGAAGEAAPAEVASGLSQPHDRRAAKALLREARDALSARQFDRAEAIAREVKTWGLRYGLFDDTPDKLAAAASEARRRAAARDADQMVRSYLGSTPGGPDPVAPDRSAPVQDGMPGPR